MNPTTCPDLTSIIIPCWNQLAFTRLCLQALFRHTRPPWELIVVNNGSTDETGDYLAGVQDAAVVPVTVLTSEHNLGFPAAVNQGLRAARGEYLVLLNNDAVVTDGWLDQLIALIRTDTGFTAEADSFTTETAEIAATKTVLDHPNLTIIDFRAEASPDRETSGQPSGGVGRPAPNETAEASPRPPPLPPPYGTLTKQLPGNQPPRTPRNSGGYFVSVPQGGEKGKRARPQLTPPHRGGETTDRARPQVGFRIGMAGPMTNYAAPPQLVEGVPYRDLDEMHAFARRWRDEHRGQWFTAGKLSGFCLLLTRAVADAIGGLDERFGLGFFDDDDLAERARRAGFELAVAHDLFVHHFGSRTFVGNGVDAEALLEENARRFAAKWGHDTPRGRRVALRAWTTQEHPQREGNALRETERPRIAPVQAGGDSGLQIPNSKLSEWNEDRSGRSVTASLVMIVRDEESNLARCLGSVRGLFDEIVVVDTGSTDRTVDIAREFGARVFDFVWVDDFAAARNAALARARGDYAFWLDADDVLDPPEGEKLQELLDRLQPGEESAYVVRCACDPGTDGSGGETVVDHIRLFPLREEIRWSYRVHEQILPSLRRAQVPVVWTDVVVRHTGYTDPAVRTRKLQRDSRILHEELAERPEDPFVLFNLGSIAVERQDWPEALTSLRCSLAGSAPTDSITRKLFALLARVHQMLGETREALRVCAEGLSLDPDDAELLFRKAVVHRHRGEPAEAEACWRRILELRRPDRFASVDMGIYGHLTRRNLAALARERGDADEEARLWAAVLAECPGDREARARLDQLRGSSPGPQPEIPP